MTETTDALARLHTRLVDACKGYEEGLDLADSPQIKALFNTLLAMHRKHASELSEALTARGVAADDDGSFLQYVHKAVLNVRSATTGLGDSVLPGIRDGEERILDLYGDTFEHVAEGTELSAMLERQRSEVAAQVRALAEFERASEV